MDPAWYEFKMALHRVLISGIGIAGPTLAYWLTVTPLRGADATIGAQKTNATFSPRCVTISCCILTERVIACITKSCVSAKLVNIKPNAIPDSNVVIRTSPYLRRGRLNAKSL